MCLARDLGEIWDHWETLVDEIHALDERVAGSIREKVGYIEGAPQDQCAASTDVSGNDFPQRLIEVHVIQHQAAFQVKEFVSGADLLSNLVKVLNSDEQDTRNRVGLDEAHMVIGFPVLCHKHGLVAQGGRWEELRQR